MKTQLFFDLTTEPRHISVYFRDSHEVEETVEELRKCGVAVFEINGAELSSQEDLWKAFAVALRMPKGWYGDEEYAPNVNAFLEYLDDVVEWVPAKGHIVLIRHADQFWSAAPRLAGDLVEWWQFAISGHQASVHLVFVW